MSEPTAEGTDTGPIKSQYIKEETAEVKQARAELRKKNLAAYEEREKPKGKLDASLKKTNSYVKKLKTINDDNAQQLVKEFAGLNLSRYVTECVASLAEAKLKNADMSGAVAVASVFHQRYEDFASALVPQLFKVFNPKNELPEAEKVPKRRMHLRLLIELFLAGVVKDDTQIGKLLTMILSTRKEEEALGVNLSIIVSFLKYGHRLLNVPEQDESEPGTVLFSEALRTSLHESFQAHWKLTSDVLEREYIKLRKMEKENRHMMHHKGEVPEARQTKTDDLVKSCEKLLANASIVASILGYKLPPLAEELEDEIAIEATATIFTAGPGVERESAFDDEATRSFYEDIPNLRDSLPDILFEGSGSAQGRLQRQAEAEAEEAAVTTDQDLPDIDEDTLLAPGDKPAASQSETADPDTADDPDDDENNAETSLPEPDLQVDIDEYEDSEQPVQLSEFDLLLTKLTSMGNREQVDAMAMDICYHNSKANRKKLVRELYCVPRSKLDLLPKYARLTAILNRVLPDIGPALVKLLFNQFWGQLMSKDQTNLESKIKCIRFLGELAKVRVCPSKEIFRCINKCLDNFNHHYIDVVCHMLETCGRWMYKSPDTHVRTKNALTRLMRLKEAKHLDQRQDLMVQNAFYQCQPPERAATRPRKERTPEDLYIRKLLFLDLSPARHSYDKVLQRLRKMDWSKCEEYMYNAFIKIEKAKHDNVASMATLLKQLGRYHPKFLTRVIDDLLDLAAVPAVLTPLAEQQKRIMQMRYVAAMFVYELTDSRTIFDLLYTLIDEQKNEAAAEANSTREKPLTTADETFSIVLVCTLLDECGSYFDRGITGKRLDVFLLRFQYYCYGKKSIPMVVEFMLQDTFELLRPRMKRLSLEQCEEELSRLPQVYGSTPVALLGLPTFEIELPNTAPSPDEEAVDPEVDGTDLNDESDDESDDDTDTDSDSDDDSDLSDDSDLDSDASVSQESDDDDFAYHKKTGVAKAEDDMFMAELNKMMADSLDQRKLEGRKETTNLEMASSKNFTDVRPNAATRAAPGSDGAAGSRQGGSKPAMTFGFLTRKNNKPQVRQLEIPADVLLATNTAANVEKDRASKEGVKQFVLDYHQQQIEEERRQNFLVQARQTNARGPNQKERRQQQKEKQEYRAPSAPAGGRLYPATEREKHQDRHTRR